MARDWSQEDFAELADWDEDTVELTVGGGHRVILNTKHGQVIIDVRGEDVNAFVFVNGERKDIVLLRASTSAPGDRSEPLSAGFMECGQSDNEAD